MIGIDRKTGRTINEWEQFVSRVTQVMTTQISRREKRREFGSRIPELLSENMSDGVLMLAQSYAIEASYPAINGLSEFSPSRCVASRSTSGIVLRFWGKWAGQDVEFEVFV